MILDRSQAPLVSLEIATVAHAEEMFSLLEPNHTKNLQFFSTAVDLQRQIDYLTAIENSQDDDLWVIRENATGRMVGTIGLHEIDDNLALARIGLLIFRAADRDRGFGRAAIEELLSYFFTWLKFNKVYVNVFAENAAGQNYWQHLGFTIEGRLREEYLLDGKYHDLIRLTLLAREWAERYRKE